jgi:ribosome-associated protein
LIDTHSIAGEADTLRKEISIATAAALDKKANDLVVLDLQGISTFTDYFLICHGTSVADAGDRRRGRERLRAEKRRGSVEGYRAGVDPDGLRRFVVHIFTRTGASTSTRAPVGGRAAGRRGRRRGASPAPPPPGALDDP